MTYRPRAPRDRRSLQAGPHDRGGTDGERANSDRRAACLNRFPPIDDRGRVATLRYELRHARRRCTGPFGKEKYTPASFS